MAIDVEKETRRRLPPGQRLTTAFPVLTYGGTPKIDLSTWKFHVWGLVEEELSFTWEEFNSLPQSTIVTDIHCVTTWSRFDNEWKGVLFKDLMAKIRVKPEGKFVMEHSYGGYTTNLPLAELLDDDVILAHTHDGKPLPPEHGGPLRLVVPKLYFWKSAKWLGGIQFLDKDRPGFWEMYGYHMHGDPWKEERYS
jgi:DMSO/TMAO reductase YedYZ molybdopterin-dependent catalytic subunit